MPLTDPRCPVLTLVHALEHKYHLAPVEATVVHTPDGPNEFDAREATRMKHYYWVCLDLRLYLPFAGNRIPSQEPQNFYKLLLRRLHAEPGMSSNQYLTLLNNDRKKHKKAPLPLEDPPHAPPLPDLGDDCILAPPPPGVPAPVPKPKPGPTVGRRVAGASHGGAGKAPPPAPPAPLPLPPAPGPGPLPDPADEDIILAPAAEAPPPKRARRAKRDLTDKWVDALDGCRIMFEPAYVNVTTSKSYVNWNIKCPNHDECYKTRGDSDEMRASFGEIEPPAFLHAWSHTVWDEARYKTHRSQPPSKADVAAFATGRADELRDVVARAKAV